MIARPRPFRALAWACLTSALALTGAALAQSSGGIYTMNLSAIAGGGGYSSGGVFELDGTVGQPGASNAQVGGVFAITAGFHQSATGATADDVFRNGFEGL